MRTLGQSAEPGILRTACRLACVAGTTQLATVKPGEASYVFCRRKAQQGPDSKCEEATSQAQATTWMVLSKVHLNHDPDSRQAACLAK